MKGNLTALKVTRIRELGMYADGGGLFLQVTKGGRSWVFRYMIAGQAREMGLGSATTITLAEARNRLRRRKTVTRSGDRPYRATKERAGQSSSQCRQGHDIPTGGFGLHRHAKGGVA
jgi:hypothetical protein